MSAIKIFSVIGCGEFGSFAAQHLAPDNAEVLVFDKNPNLLPPRNAKKAGFVTVAGADVIIVAVPYDAYESVVPALAKQTHPESLIVDVCSVKMKPTALFKKHGLLDRDNVLMTHPLFGPQSTAKGIDGKNLNLVVTQQSGILAKQLLATWSQKGINLIQMSAEEHDREIAKVHALTFFVGRALLELGIEPSPLNTPYYSELLDLIATERHHSAELFFTIQRHNPFADDVRVNLISKLAELEERIIQP